MKFYYILATIGGVALFRLIYITFIKKLIEPDEYFRRSMNLDIYFYRKKASIKVIEDLLLLENLTEQNKYNAYFYLGEIYYKMKHYEKSCDMFEMGFEIIKDGKFYYRDYFLTMIKANLLAGKVNYAKELYHNFLERKNYDNQFKRVLKLSKKINFSNI